MKGYFAIIASILMLATTAFAKGWTAAPTGVDQTAVYGTPADNGIQTTWAAPYGTDQKTSSAILTSTTPSTGVVLTAGQRGGGMHGGFSGRANRGPGFQSRSFGDRSFRGGFDRDRFMHRDFDRDRFHRDFDRDHFFPRHRFFDRDDFFFGGFGYYPYGGYYTYPYGYYPYYYYPYNYYYPYSYSYPYGYLYSYPYFYFSW